MELLSVISTVAVLSTIGIPMMEQLKESALNLKATGELNRLHPVIEKYYTEYGKYPEELTQKRLLRIGDIYELKLRDPFNNENYQINTFTARGSKKYFVIYSMGKNGVSDLLFAPNKVINNGDDVFVTNLPEGDGL